MLAALSFVAGYAETRDNIPVLAHIKFAAAGNRIEVSATDLDSGASDSFPARVDAPIGFESVCVPAAALLKAIKGSSASEIEFNLSAGTANVIFGRTRVSLPFLPAADFPDVGTITNPACVLNMDGEELSRHIGRVAFAQSSEETRYYLCGTAWTAFGDMLEICATDGHKMAVTSFKADVEKLPQIIVPSRFKLPKWSGDVAVEIGAYMIAFRSGAQRVFTKLIDGTFPNYRRVIIHDGSRLLFDRKELASACRSCAIVADAREHFVLFIGRNGVAEFIAQTKKGEVIDGVPYQGDDFQIALLQSSIAESLNSLDCEMVEIAWTDHMTPLVIRDPNDSQRLIQMVACTHPRIAQYLPQQDVAA